MNVVHLEKVYYTIRYKGCAAAARHMPYGIEAQTISEQVAAVGKELGGPLFTYPPFEVTPLGRQVYRWIRGLFDRTDRIHRWQKLTGQPLDFACAASPLVPAYFHDMIELLQLRHPNIHISLPTGSESQLHEMLLTNHADIVIVPHDPEVPRKFVACTPLVAIPLVLLVHREAPWGDAAELWAMATAKDPVIRVPLVMAQSAATLAEVFADQLARLGVAWEPTVDAGALGTITTLIAGRKSWVGATLDIPSLVDHPDVRRLPLRNFDPLTIVAYQRKPSAPLPKLVVAALRERAKRVLTESKQWLPAVVASRHGRRAPPRRLNFNRL